MNKTKIDWVKNPDGTPGYTWNSITGCLNHINGMCKGGGFPCYAYRLANGRLKRLYQVNTVLPRHDEPDHIAHHLDPFYPRFWPERLEELPVLKTYQGRFSSVVKNALYEKQRKGIFVCDMSDLFGIGIPEAWTRQVLWEIANCPEHRFYLLTKQPQNLIKFSPFPDNCWVGVTATNRRMMTLALHHLFSIEAKVKYISLEPLLEDVMEGYCNFPPGLPCEWERIDWLIIGAQTKPYKPPKIEWVQEIVKAADKAGIPVFLKDNLRQMGDVSLQVGYLKQEMPK